MSEKSNRLKDKSKSANTGEGFISLLVRSHPSDVAYTINRGSTTRRDMRGLGQKRELLAVDSQ